MPLQTAERDTTIDKLVKCHKLAQQHIKDGQPNWEKVEQIMRRTEIDRVIDIPEIIKWLKTSAGGAKDPWVLNDVVRLARSLKVMRDIPAGVLGKQGEVRLGHSNCPYWRGAVPKAILVARERDMVNNVNTYVTTGDARSVADKALKFVEIADSYMQRARELAQDKVLKKLLKEELDFVTDTADIRYVGHIRKRPLIGDFKSLTEIARTMHTAFVQLASTHSLKYKAPCPLD